jgi:hypothetical protein
MTKKKKKKKKKKKIPTEVEDPSFFGHGVEEFQN